VSILRRAAAVTYLAGVGLLAACGSGGSDTTPRAETTDEIDPTTTTLTPEETDGITTTIPEEIKDDVTLKILGFDATREFLLEGGEVCKVEQILPVPVPPTDYRWNDGCPTAEPSVDRNLVIAANPANGDRFVIEVSPDGFTNLSLDSEAYLLSDDGDPTTTGADVPDSPSTNFVLPFDEYLAYNHFA
jgi:hypothetical protein